MVRTNDISMVVNIALQRTNRKRLMRKRMGVGGAKCNNQTEIGRGGGKDGGRTNVSNNLSILFACVHPCTHIILLSYVFRLNLLTDRGSWLRLIAQGRQSKGEF